MIKTPHNPKLVYGASLRSEAVSREAIGGLIIPVTSPDRDDTSLLVNLLRLRALSAPEV